MLWTGLTSIRHICRSHHASDLFHGLQVGRETAVHSEYLFVDDGCDGQTVETVRKRLPQLDIVPSLAFVSSSARIPVIE